MNAACEVVSGSGSVARRADSLVWASEQVSDAVWETLLSCLALGGRAQGAAPLLHALAGTMVDEDDDTAFAVLVSDGRTGFLLRRGRVDVTLDGQPLDNGVVVPVTVDGRTVAAGDPEAVQALIGRAPSTRHDLCDGAVAGAAFRWSAVTAMAPPAVTEESARLHAGTDPPGYPDSSNGSSQRTGAAAPDPLAAVSGRLRRPDAPAGADTHAEGTSDPEQTEFHPPPQTDETPSPAQQRSVGVLVFEDGGTANLTGDVVLGRRPERHQLVESGQAQPLVIHDPEHVLSSAHAAVRLQGDDVVVVDLDSLNGTHVAAPDAKDWTKLTSGAPYPVQDGYRMLLGWTVLTYRSDHP